MGTATFNPLATFDHVVVLMLENRSFDNLLGYLHKDSGFSQQQYAGLQGQDWFNPIPDRAQKPPHATSVKMVMNGSDFHQPFPDPGEEYPHINTQLTDNLDPANIGQPALKMQAPYNVPAGGMPKKPPMTGFVNDYVNTLQAMDDPTYKNPTYDQYKEIMQSFAPESVSVLSTLAEEFAVFDHWHCSVPSQTWCNRSFWHAASSGGFVINPAGEDGESYYEDIEQMIEWARKVWSLPTLFGRLTNKGVSAAIYTDNSVALTHLVNGVHRDSIWADSMSTFYKDLKKGKLSAYNFIEPRFMGTHHNDQHPSSTKTETSVGTVKLGEKLIYDVYTAIRNSSLRDRTLLIITHDEHGGCFDHVPPPAATPPHDPMPYKQQDFSFDRLGIRVPMVMISSHIPTGTIDNGTYDHSSFIATMGKKWGYSSLSNRDRDAATFEGVFSPTPRSWPELTEPDVPAQLAEAEAPVPMNDLQKSILFAAMVIATEEQNLSEEDKATSYQAFKAITSVQEADAYLKSVAHLFQAP